MTWSENSNWSKNDGISPIQKNSKWIPKNIKFGLLIDFDMEIRLRDLDHHFWLKINNRAQSTQHSCTL
jgi:hypothetical protein